MTSRNHVLLPAAAAITLTITGAARAQDNAAPTPPPVTATADASASATTGGGGTTDWQPKSASNRAGLDFDMFLAKNLTGLSWTPYAQYGVTDHIFVDAAVPLGYGSFHISEFGFSVSASKFTIGNPVLGAHYVDAISDDIAYFIGGSIGVPTHPSLGGSDQLAIALVVPGIARGFFDYDRFAPNSLPLRLRGGVEVRITPILFYRGDLSPVFFIPLNGNKFEVLLEQGNEIEGRLESGIGGGLRLQEVFSIGADGFAGVASPGGSDRFQSALEPFVSYEPESPNLFARLGLLMALDTPAGFAFDTNKVATVRLSGGYKW